MNNVVDVLYETLSITKKLIIDKDTPILKYPLKEEESLDILVKQGASMQMITYNNQDTCISFNLNINLEEGAKFTLYNIVTSDCNNKYNVKCNLLAQHASFDSLNVVLCGNNANYESFIDIYHLDKYTSSNLETYAISKDLAKIKLDNNATIKKGCAKSVAHQKAKGLTLSKKSSISALPNLFIDEYDVVANHAASIGSLNPDDLFYLMSRGLSKEEASKIIIMGFINPLVDKIEDSQTKEMLINSFLEKSSLK